MKKYPDITETTKRKEKHRRSLATLSFEEKVEMVFKLQERRKFIKSGRAASNSPKPKTRSA
jgi:hypothetical protein